MRTVLIPTALMLMACSGETTAPAAAGGDRPIVVMSADGEDLVIESGFVRPVAAGGNSAGYVTIRSDTADVLTGATSENFDVVELHETSAVDGAMRMRPVERIDLPAGQTVMLAPGGQHLMLLGAREDIPEGSSLTVLLQFGSGKSVAFDLPVERR